MTVAVSIVSLIAAGVCLIAALVFARADSAATEQVRKAAQTASTKLNDELSAEPAEPPDAAGEQQNPVQPQFSNMDFRGLANLAEAIEKLNRSGRFLIASVAFAAIAVVAAGAGSLGEALQ